MGALLQTKNSKRKLHSLSTVPETINNIPLWTHLAFPHEWMGKDGNSVRKNKGRKGEPSPMMDQCIDQKVLTLSKGMERNQAK